MVQYFPIVTGSLTVTGSVNVSGSITTNSTITATTLVVQTITSSISAITGSTQFGSLSSNTHTFTGSINVSGSANFSGSLTVNGTATLGTGTSSYTFGGGSAAAGNLTDKDLTLKAWSPISGVNEYAGDLILQSGVGTGNASGKLGSVIIKVGTDGATSSTLGTYNTIATFTKAGIGIGTSTPGSLLSLEKAKAGSGVESLDMLTLRITGTTAIGDALNIKFLNGTNTNVATISGILGGDNVAYGTLTFSTRNYNTDSLVEAMRLTNRGHLKASNFANPTYGNNYHQIFNNVFGDWMMEVAHYSTSPFGLLLRYANAAPRNGGAEVVYINDSTGNVFKISSNGNVYNLNGVYTSLSDIKLKENIVDATPKLDKLMQVRVRNYNLKTDPNLKQIGVIAQELEPIFPGLIEENFDRDVEGKLTGETSLGVKYSVFVPILIKAIQELTARVQELENK